MQKNCSVFSPATPRAGCRSISFRAFYRVARADDGGLVPSPGVHTLWLPVIPMQIGLVLARPTQEPWTPYRMTAAMVEAGIPAEAISIYPGGGDVGAAELASCTRSMIFGGTQRRIKRPACSGKTSITKSCSATWPTISI